MNKWFWKFMAIYRFECWKHYPTKRRMQLYKQAFRLSGLQDDMPAAREGKGEA